ncbi:sugar ABC transporter permease [Paenibacillus baekrokdamisoli]|uniref:Sugar ABC transporter permease n=1 Tax=Paenibacillus baekrokdamisoli TaxID=1712516 RepID=A0A3G9JHU7_9BACL|nr:ABC transporter permease subunit [Paenibacillus baekrokdamisoli]MBB3068802.1 putative aldouronate transport system permease protein [Paenibacillus baekrokdamisoli]BBH23628.1 sugar ABC transporter permease [Paenibacillus baekrokdamisoli]
MKKRSLRLEVPFHLMLLPGALLVFIFAYAPMFGIIIAFQKYYPTKGFFHSAWVGLDNFRYIFMLPNFGRVMWNTVYIASMKIILTLIIPVLTALLLNEVRKQFFKRIVQTFIYLPYFLSWVILAGILMDVLSLDGVVNHLLGFMNIKPIFFLGDNKWFPWTLIASDTWKQFGFDTIIYLAALTGINPTLYEAAVLDGAGRWKQTLYVTLPGILPIVILMMTLSLGNVLNAGFDQVFNLYSAPVMESGDIIDTMIYRMGLQNFQFSVSAALGVFKSAVSFVLISVSYWCAYRFANYRIF